MKKQFLCALAIALTATCMIGCGKKKSKSVFDPDESISSGSIRTGKTFKDALAFNYDNYTIESYQLYGDGEGTNTAYEFVINGIVYVLDYDYVEMTGELSYLLYTSTQEDDYMYWTKADGYEYDGWIANGYRDSDLAMHNAYFDLPYFLSALTENDVDYILGGYYVKESAMNKLYSHGLEFYGDMWTGYSNITSIGMLIDETTGAITKIVGAVSETSDDGFIVNVSAVGTTKVPEGEKLPKAPYYNSDSDRNIYTYAEMKGDDYVPDVWPESVSLAIVETDYKKEAGYDAVISLDDSLEVAYTIKPSTANRIEWEWKVSDSNIIDMNYKIVNGHKYISGVGVGEATVYIQVQLEDKTWIKSETLKIKVVGAPEQDKTNAVYDLTVTGSEYAYEMVDEKKVEDKNVTNISAYNAIDTKANFTIKGHNVETIEAKYTDSFGENGMVMTVNPSSQDYMNNGFYSEVTFDFGDQEVVSMSFYYALHKSNQRSGAVDNLAEAYIATSSDGENWSAPINIKDEMVANFEKININYNSNLKLMEKSFTKASKVKLYFRSSMVGKNFIICMNNFVFKNDSTCHNHEEGETFDVVSIEINAPTTTLKPGQTTQFSAKVLPGLATNKNVTWKVSNPAVGKISESGLFTALGDGDTMVYAESVNGVKSNTVNVKVVAQEYLDSKYVGRVYFDDNIIINMKINTVRVEIVSTTKATVTITPDGGTASSVDYTYYTQDEDSLTPFVFYADNGDTLKLKFYDEQAYVYLKMGNKIIVGDNTNKMEEFALYVRATSLTIKHDSTEVSSANIKVDEKYYVTVSVKPDKASFKEITAISSNPTVAQVVFDEYRFYVKGIAPGDATITFKNADGVSKTLAIHVTTPIKLTNLSVSVDKNTFEVGQTATATASLTPTNADTLSLTWTSSDPSVAKVTASSDGKSATVLGMKVGTATITVKDSVTEKEATFNVKINASTAIIDPQYVGTWVGYDDMGNDIEFEVKADGTAVLRIYDEDDHFSAPVAIFTFTISPEKLNGNDVSFTYDEDDTTVVGFYSGCLYIDDANSNLWDNDSYSWGFYSEYAEVTKA